MNFFSGYLSELYLQILRYSNQLSLQFGPAGAPLLLDRKHCIGYAFPFLHPEACICICVSASRICPFSTMPRRSHTILLRLLDRFANVRMLHGSRVGSTLYNHIALRQFVGYIITAQHPWRGVANMKRAGSTLNVYSRCVLRFKNHVFVLRLMPAPWF